MKIPFDDFSFEIGYDTHEAVDIVVEVDEEGWKVIEGQIRLYDMEVDGLYQLVMFDVPEFVEIIEGKLKHFFRKLSSKYYE